MEGKYGGGYCEKENKFITFKKWFKVDEYGAQTAVYSEGTTNCPIKDLPKLINSIKEAQTIANQALEKK